MRFSRSQVDAENAELESLVNNAPMNPGHSDAVEYLTQCEEFLMQKGKSFTLLNYDLRIALGKIISNMEKVIKIVPQ